MVRSSSPDEGTATSARFAWLAAGFGFTIVGGFVLVLWAIASGATDDVAASPLHLPLYLGLLALVVTCGWRGYAAQRRGEGWRRALPPGYGSLALGAALFVVGLILDVGWREGVGIIPGIEDGFAPSRVVIVIALALIAVAPLRAAYLGGPGWVPRGPVLLSSALAIVAVGWPGGFHPAASAWFATDPDLPSVQVDLWVMDADGGHQTRVIEADPDFSFGYASWAPDGSRITYTRFFVPPAGIGSSEATIWVADADGGNPTSPFDSSEWRWIPRFTPDGASLVFTQEAQGGPWMEEGPVGPGVGAGPQGPLSIPLPNADIWRADAAGGGAEQRLSDSAGDDRAPVPSPDGRLVLFDSTRDGNTELYVADADGASPRRLTDDPGEDWGATWSPDGSQIAFNSSRSGNMQIFVMDADGGNVHQLTSGDGDFVTPSWSPDGSRIAFTSRDTDLRGQIWSMATDGSDLRDLSRSPGSDDQVWTGGWGPDDRIVFTRGPAEVPEATGLVRQDLGTAALLMTIAAFAAVLVVLARTLPPIGSFTAVLVIGTALLAVPNGEWRFVVAGGAAGVLTDLAAWLAPADLRGRLAGAVSTSAFVLGSGSIALATTGLDWTPTLLLGVALAGGAIGWGLGALEASGHRSSVPEPP